MASTKITGLFLGAGASVEAGMPLVWELTAELKAVFTSTRIRAENARARTLGVGFSDDVLDDLLGAFQRPEMHYEAVLGFLQTQFGRKRTLAQGYHGAYAWLVNAVYGALDLKQVNQKPYLERVLPFYDGIASLAAENTPLWVFTLNHDLPQGPASWSVARLSGRSSGYVDLDFRSLLGHRAAYQIIVRHNIISTAPI